MHYPSQQLHLFLKKHKMLDRTHIAEQSFDSYVEEHTIGKTLSISVRTLAEIS